MAEYSAVTPKSILPKDWFDTTIFITFRVIPPEKRLPMNCFETFPGCSPPSIVSEKKNNKNDRSPFSPKRYDE